MTGAALVNDNRLTYGHHAAAAAMRRCGHANGYARTLVTGLWPSLDVFPPGRKLRRRTLRLPASAAAQAAE